MNQQLIKRATLLNSFFRIADIITIVVSGALASLTKFGYLGVPNQYFFFITILAFITFNVFSALNIYQGWRGKSLFTELTHLTLAWLIVILLASTLTFITKTGPDFSRVWAGWTFAVTYIGLISYRTVVRLLISHLQEAGYNQKQIIIIGAGNLGQRARSAMQQQTWAGLIPVAFFDDKRQGEIYNNVPVKGSIDESITFIEEKRKSKPVDQVWIALPLSAQKEIENLQIALQDTATKIYFIPDLFGFNLASYTVDEMVGLPVMNMSAPPMSGWSATLKRIDCLLYTSPSPRDKRQSRMPSSA